MSFDQIVSLSSALISFVGLLLVAWQLRDGNKQQELASLVEIYDINRELISLGFSHPQLFAILRDTKDADLVWERRYLQMWLNQLSLIHSYLKRSVCDAELKESLERSLADFMMMENMQSHWQKYAQFYPASFQQMVNDCIKKGKPPEAAPMTSGR